MIVGVIKIRSSFCSFFDELYRKRFFMIGRSPSMGNLLTFFSSVSNIIPPISNVSPFFTLTFVFVSRLDIIGRLSSPIYPIIN